MRLADLMRGELEAQAVKIRRRLRNAILPVAHVMIRLRIVHGKRKQPEIELLDTGHGERMGRRYAHRACFSMQSGRERLAHCVDAPADAMPGFEDDGLVAGAL